MKFFDGIIFDGGRLGLSFFSCVLNHLGTPVCRLSRGEALNSSSYLVIACLHERFLRGRGEARSRPTRIHGAKIYGIELNGIKAVARSCGEIRTARPPRCIARVRHLMMLAFPISDFPPCRARNETLRHWDFFRLLKMDDFQE